MGSHYQIPELLEMGKAILGLDLGIVSRIRGDEYTVVACSRNNFNIRPGDIFELRDTYCRDVIRRQKTTHYPDVAQIVELLQHPCYLNTQLRAYIGTPILIEDEIWGTLNYSSLTARKTDYTEKEIDLLEQQAIIIADKLMSQFSENMA